VRAGINQFGDHPRLIDRVGEPIRVARCAWLSDSISGEERLAALLVPTIEQALAPLSGMETSLRIGWILALSDDRPGRPRDSARFLARCIEEEVRNEVAASAVLEGGHAAGLAAVGAASRKVERGELDLCLVLAVDSYLNVETLDWLEANDQLHGAGLLNNAWGFIPGEAAGALLLASDRAVQAGGLAPFAAILGFGSAIEPHRIKTDSVCVGTGLTAAIRDAVETLPARELVDEVYCDLNGEPYRADEYGFAVLRTKQHFSRPSEFVAAADCWGDVGAAGGVLNCILASVAGVKRYAKGARSLVWASAENGERAALLMSSEAPQ
jgi:3-oxoacyl-[acyl-carrier-protein] synthase-1